MSPTRASSRSAIPRLCAWRFKTPTNREWLSTATIHPGEFWASTRRLERPFAHLYETGRMRRVYLRGHNNILKRVLLQAGALNLGLLMRQVVGIGTPRSLQGRALALLRCLWSLIRRPDTRWDAIWTRYRPSVSLDHLLAHRDDRPLDLSVGTVFTTGC